MPGKLFDDGSDLDAPSPFHQYDEQLDDGPADLQLNEYAQEDFEFEGSTSEETSPNFPHALQDTRRMLIRMAKISGHQSGYAESPRVDFVDQHRDAERKEKSELIKQANEDFEKRGGRWPDEGQDTQPAPFKPIPSEVRAAAELLGADPKTLSWPRYIAQLPQKEKLALLQAAREASFDVPDNLSEQDFQQWLATNLTSAATQERSSRWNKKIFSREHQPSNLGSMRHDGTPTIYRNPAAPEQTGLTGIVRTRKSQAGVAASSEWKQKAEQHQLPNAVTKCKMTGESLIQQTSGRFKSWQVAPNIHGMGLKGAWKAVDAAAYLSLSHDQLEAAYKVKPGSLVGAKVTGQIPEFVHQLAKDGDAWAVLAMNINHPVWAKTARFLVMLRDTLYFRLDEQGVREAQQIGNNIASKLKQAYPDRFVDDRSVAVAK